MKVTQFKLEVRFEEQPPGTGPAAWIDLVSLVPRRGDLITVCGLTGSVTDVNWDFSRALITVSVRLLASDAEKAPGGLTGNESN